MKALISPNEPVESGYRVAQVSAKSFDVALPLFWVDCGNEIAADAHWFDPETEQFSPVPVSSVESLEVQASSQPVVNGAETL